MTWVKLDDGFFLHPKARAAGKDGRALWFAGMCYCSSNLTDGFIADDALPLVLAMAEVSKKVTRKLVEVGMWEQASNGFRVHNYETRQRTRNEVEAERESTRERVKKHRKKTVGNNVTNDGGNGGGNALVRPLEVEVDTDLPSSVTHLEPQATAPDDEDGFAETRPIDRVEVTVRAVFERCADARMQGIAPNTPGPYRQRVLGNLETEHGEQLRHLIASHPNAPIESLAGAVLGEQNSLHLYRIAEAG